MSDSQGVLRVVAVGPLVTLQDAGRFGRLRFGVAASGPMDRFAHAAANAAVGNDRDATAIEVSSGGLVVECARRPITVGVAGGRARVLVDGEHTESWVVVTLQPGQRLEVRAGEWGSWTYVAVAADIVSSRWLGSSATHSIAGLGGGFLETGHTLELVDPRLETDREGPFADHAPDRTSAPTRVVLGPQRHRFTETAEQQLRHAEFRLTSAYDRMGLRLDGPALELVDALSIASEPIIRGSIQVAGDGVPTVLLADHQTTGGYPKIATVISCDLDGFVQRRPGDTVRFQVVEPDEAVAVAREAATRERASLASIGRSGRNLGARLLREDLIGGRFTSTFDPDS